MLERIASTGLGRIVVILTVDSPRRRVSSDLDPRPQSNGALSGWANRLLLSVYRALESRIDCDPDAFDLVDAPMLETIPRYMLEGQDAAGSAGHDSALEEVRQLGLDVIVQLGLPTAAPMLASVTKRGVWSLNHAHCAGSDAMAAGFWPVCRRWPVIESRVDAMQPDGVTVTLARSITGTNPFAVKLCRSALYWKTLSLIPRELGVLQRSSNRSVSTHADAPSPGGIPGPVGALGAPGVAQLVVHIMRNILRRGTDWAWRHFAREEWMLLYRLGDGRSTAIAEFRRIIPPKDRYWADPCVIRRDDAYFIFFEEFPYTSGRGHLSVLTLSLKGASGVAAPILERPYHLSYPFVFEEGGEFFMIPESSANRTIDLYRCVQFPEKWEFVQTLLGNVVAVDTTVFKDCGKWWMFTSMVERAGASSCEELFLYSSESLIDGTWTPHPQNPVVSDVRSARPAGRVFREHGRLFRPAQDCSVRYGYAIVLNEITTLTESEYGEIETVSIKPPWTRGFIATHTLSEAPGVTVVDALRPRLKW